MRRNGLRRTPRQQARAMSVGPARKAVESNGLSEPWFAGCWEKAPRLLPEISMPYQNGKVHPYPAFGQSDARPMPRGLFRSFWIYKDFRSRPAPTAAVPKSSVWKSNRMGRRLGRSRWREAKGTTPEGRQHGLWKLPPELSSSLGRGHPARALRKPGWVRPCPSPSRARVCGWEDPRRTPLAWLRKRESDRARRRRRAARPR